MRNTFNTLSSIADIRTFFSLAYIYNKLNDKKPNFHASAHLFTDHVGEKFCVENNSKASSSPHDNSTPVKVRMINP